MPGYSKNEIEARSCLTIIIREIYKCNESEGCRNPYVAEMRALSIDYVAASQFSYDVKFSNVKGSDFVVSGILNLGWCKHFVKGKRRLKKGDYQTAKSTVASLSEHQSQINIPLKMEKFPASKGNINTLFIFFCTVFPSLKIDAAYIGGRNIKDSPVNK